jgi:hypothetical protein
MNTTRTILAQVRNITTGEWSDLYRQFMAGAMLPSYTDSRSGKQKRFTRSDVQIILDRLGAPRQQVGA